MIDILIVYGIIFLLGLLITGVSFFADILGDAVEGALNGVGNALEGISSLGGAFDGVSFHGFGTFTLGAFCTTFGGAGVYLLLAYPDISPFVLVPASLLISLAITLVSTYVMSKVFSNSPQSIRKLRDFIGKEGVVTVEIKGAGDKGEVLFVDGSHKSLLAVSDENLPKGTNVIVTELNGDLVKVKKISSKTEEAEK
jgi:membrane protein implicated in regulation of membrane protease activity